MSLSTDFWGDLARSNDAAANAQSLPPIAYCDASVLEIEQKQVFSQGWLPVGRADQAKAPGDYVTLDICNRSIILIRGKAGELYALANTCRHRGSRLLEGSGSCSGIRCPFHHWLYRLDGSLAAAPNIELAADVDYSICRFKTAERLGFVFVSLMDDPPDIDLWLGNFAEVHKEWPLADLVQTRRRARDVAVNWKAFLDVFNEYYHLPYVHKTSIDARFQTPDPGDIVTGNFATQYGETDGSAALLEPQQTRAFPAMPGLERKAARGVRYTWLFPCLSFAAAKEVAWVYEAYPINANKTRVIQTVAFHPATVKRAEFDKTARYYYDRMDRALEEDVAALEFQAAGLKSPDATQGPFSGRLEPSVAAFAQWYAKKMTVLDQSWEQSA